MRILLAFILVIFLGAAACAGALYFLPSFVKMEGPLAAPEQVLIEPGTGVWQMAQKLQDVGVLREPYSFAALVALRDVGGRLQAGEYVFDAGVSVEGVLEKIYKGDVVRRLVTVPEGMNSYQVAEILRGVQDLKGEIDVPLEGSVLPESYAYVRGDTRASVLAHMQGAMSRALDELWEQRVEGLPFTTKEEALVLASIVEKETGVVAERERVAGVFVNRLRLGMRLQSDPTVVYGITGGKSHIERVLYAHLEADSPYNTYKNVGLPPAPIANPGRAAIAAVLNPEVHDFLYFVADGTGGHVFAKSLAEHNVNVARFRALQRAQSKASAP